MGCRTSALFIFILTGFLFTLLIIGPQSVSAFDRPWCARIGPTANQCAAQARNYGYTTADEQADFLDGCFTGYSKIGMKCWQETNFQNFKSFIKNEMHGLCDGLSWPPNTATHRDGCHEMTWEWSAAIEKVTPP